LLWLRLLRSGPPALRAFVAVWEPREMLGLLGADPDDDPRFTSELFERVAGVAHYRLPGRGRESMRCAIAPG